MSSTFNAEPIAQYGLGIAEAIAMLLVVNAIANLNGAARVDLPVLVGVIAMTTAILASRLVKQRFRRIFTRIVALAPLATLGVLLTSGTLASLSSGRLSAAEVLSGGFVHGPSRASVLATAVALSAALWIRGTWIGTTPISVSNSQTSYLVIALSLLLVLVICRADNSVAIRTATPLVVWWCALAIALGFLATAIPRHSRQIEEALQIPAKRFETRWLATVAAPFAAVLIVSVALAISSNAVRIRFGNGEAQVIRRPSSTVNPRPTPLPLSRTPGGVTAHSAASLGTPWLWALVGTFLLACIVGLMLWLSRRQSAARQADLPNSARPEDRPERLYSWRELLQRLTAYLTGLRRTRRSEVLMEIQPQAFERAGEITIREYYRQLLIASRQSGFGRWPAETSREFDHRLRAILGSATNPLSELTPRYDAVRYGDSTNNWVAPRIVMERVRDLMASFELAQSETPTAGITGLIPAGSNEWMSFTNAVGDDSIGSLIQLADARRRARQRLMIASLCALLTVGLLLAFVVL